jgi:hypothetical protein
VRFIGTTLWADFDCFAPRATTPAETLKRRQSAFRAANFYLRRNTCLIDGQPMLAEAMRELSLQCQEWLTNALAQPFEGPTVVITHFAPTLHSADPRYGLAPSTAGFCNGLEHLLPAADVWLHGHLHCRVDVTVPTAGPGAPHRTGCRILANPLGYAHKGEQLAFEPVLCVDVAAAL